MKDQQQLEKDERLQGNEDATDEEIDAMSEWETITAEAAERALTGCTFSSYVFVFRGRRGDILKILWWTGDGLCLLAKRLERRRFIWPQTTEGTVSLSLTSYPCYSKELIGDSRNVRSACPATMTVIRRISCSGIAFKTDLVD